MDFDAIERHNANDSTKLSVLSENRVSDSLYGNVRVFWTIQRRNFERKIRQHFRLTRVPSDGKRERRKGELSDIEQQCHTDILLDGFVNVKYAFAWINFGCLPFAVVHRPVASVVVPLLGQSVEPRSQTPKRRWPSGSARVPSGRMTATCSSRPRPANSSLLQDSANFRPRCFPNPAPALQIRAIVRLESRSDFARCFLNSFTRTAVYTGCFTRDETEGSCINTNHYR